MSSKGANASSGGISSADAAFRHFFTRLTTAEIQKGRNDTVTNNKKDKHDSNDAIPHTHASIVARDALAIECWMQLHSSMPHLHAHHLEALYTWIQQHILSNHTNMPTSLSLIPTYAPPSLYSPSETQFELTLDLLSTLRTIGHTPIGHSRIAHHTNGGGVDSTSAKSSNATSVEPISEPSFAEALAADAGRAVIPLSRLRDESVEKAEKKAAAAAEVNIDLTTTRQNVDSKMHAAASIYALLVVHLPSLLMQSLSSASANPSSAAAAIARAANYLQHIPADLHLDRQRRIEEEIANKIAAPVFDLPELEPESDTAHIEEVDDDEDESQQCDDDSSDDDFTADPIPPDSDDDDGLLTGSGSGWASLDDLLPASSDPSLSSTIATLQHRLLTLVEHFWDDDLLGLPGVMQHTDWDRAMMTLWRIALRNSRATVGPIDPRMTPRGPFAPTHIQTDRGLETLRMHVLRLLTSQVCSDPTQNVCRLFDPIVQEVLGMPMRVPGMGSATTDDGDEDDDEGDVGIDSDGLLANDVYEYRQLLPFTRLPRTRLFIELLARACEVTRIHSFPLQPSAITIAGAASAASHTSQPTSTRHIWTFIHHNLTWLMKRIQRFRQTWIHLLETQQSPFYVAGLREAVGEFRLICVIIAFYMLHPPSASSSTPTATAGSKSPSITSSVDPGVELIKRGTMQHIIALCILSQSASAHSHGDGVAACCTACRAFEQSHTLSGMVTLTLTVAIDGAVSCDITPYRVPNADDEPNTTVEHVGSVRLQPTSSASTHQSNPLSLAHQLLLTCVTYSKCVSHLVYAHPTAMEFFSCPCYESQHGLVCMMLPIWLSMNTREMTSEAVLTLPDGALPSTSKSSVTPTPAGTNGTTVKSKKEKKSKLVVSSIVTDCHDDDSNSVVTSSELSWTNSSSLTGGIVVNAIQRTMHVITQAIEAVQTANDTTNINDAIIPDRELDFLQHLLGHVYAFATSSPARRVTLTLLAAGKLTSRDLDPTRSVERDMLTALLAKLISLKSLLPVVSRRINNAIHSTHGQAPMTELNHQHQDQTAHIDEVAESPDGHAQRQRKTRLESCQANVTRMQQWLKRMSMEVAKKD